MIKGATLSDDKLYRFELHRIFDNSKPIVAFVGLNPSTADDKIDDPTITKCINYCKNWGYGGFYMVNLFAYRATEPKNMMEFADPIGFENDKYLKLLFEKVDKVICCWGELGTFKNRANEVLQLIKEPYCLKINKNGTPAHPLYLKGDLVPMKFGESETSKTIKEEKTHSFLTEFSMLDNNIKNYDDDLEIVTFLSTHPSLIDLYNDIKKVENLAVVIPLVSLVDDSKFIVDLHVIVKHENKSEIGQWNYYISENFVNTKTNLVRLFQTLEGATNCDTAELLDNIKYRHC